MYIVKKFLLKNIIKLLKTSYSFLCENFVNFCFSISFFFLVEEIAYLLAKF